MSKANKEQSKMLKKQLSIEKELTREKKIALNKAIVAKFHPAPDLSTISPQIAKERQKIKHEKKMLEKAKKMVLHKNGVIPASCRASRRSLK